MDLTTVDWSTVTFPGTACVNGASSADEVPLGDNVRFSGQGQGGSSQSYVSQAGLPPSYGTLDDGTQIAMISVVCFPEGANATSGVGVLVYAADADRPRLLGAFANGELGVVPETDVWLVPTVLSVVNGAVTVDGVYLQSTDSRADPSGRGWTTLEYADGALTPSGVIHIGERPDADPSGEGDEPETIWFDPPVLIHAEADLINLTGTPDDFRQHVWQQAQAVLANCPDDPRAGIAVVNYRSDGYGLGTRQCQGNSSGELWAARGGTWTLVVASNELLPCDPLREYAYPVELLEGYAAPICGESDGSLSDYPGDETPAAPPSTPQTEGATFIDYCGPAFKTCVPVTGRADLDRLYDAPADFKQFVLKEVRTEEEGSGCAPRGLSQSPAHGRLRDRFSRLRRRLRRVRRLVGQDRRRLEAAVRRSRGPALFTPGVRPVPVRGRAELHRRCRTPPEQLANAKHELGTADPDPVAIGEPGGHNHWKAVEEGPVGRVQVGEHVALCGR